MSGFENIAIWLDPVFIVPFRLMPAPWAGFAFGLVCLGLVATALGELTLGLVYMINRRYLDEVNKDMTANHNLAVKALAYKDKASYVACNGLANDAFGKNFFSHIALFASSLWPVFFALGWLDYRFGQLDLQMPFIGSVGPAFFFIPTYILVRIVFSRLRHRLPVFRAFKKMIDATEAPGALLNYADIPDIARASNGQAMENERVNSVRPVFD